MAVSDSSLHIVCEDNWHEHNVATLLCAEYRLTWLHDVCFVAIDRLERVQNYWAGLAGLLTPLTFTRHRLSPLAAYTSGAYFLRNGRW